IFLLSAVLHGTGFYVLLHLKFNYKIFQSKTKTAVVPFVPEGMIWFTKTPRGIAEAQVHPEPVIVKPGRPAQPPGQSGGDTAKPQAQQPGAQPGARPGVRGEPGAAGFPYSEFRLTYPKDSPLNLAKPSENSIESLLKPDRYRSWLGNDFSKYLGTVKGPTGTAGSAGGQLGSGGGGGAVGPPRGSPAPPNIVRYDFTPWANEVMTRVQKNWSLGQDAFAGYIGEVGVTVMMSKAGELLAVEIGESSKIDLLDQAAVKAVRLSAPFPPLPSDFPNSSLEMYLVFQYGY
ncbi:MAG: TonB family protein, partial [Candidatus Aminicenantes bacterium]|nr:TonB family protein [Candidatus Aminicenantes bacterium]